MISRRRLLQYASAVVPFQALGLFARPQAASTDIATSQDVVRDSFPSHPPELAREIVLVSHFSLKRVQELVSGRPALARAAWDWGFGDWESALGAASHMGNQPIAEYLISRGARPSIFSATMLGQLEVVKAFVAAQPGIQRIQGPHSIPLLAHARVGGEASRSVLEFLQSLEGADQDRPLPLSAEEAAALTGTYVFGPVAGQQIEVDADMRMYASTKMYSYPPQLNWTRKGTTSRPLFHLGEHTFYPSGVPAVRIRFLQENGGVTMTIHDPGLILTARKAPSRS